VTSGLMHFAVGVVAPAAMGHDMMRLSPSHNRVSPESRNDAVQFGTIVSG